MVKEQKDELYYIFPHRMRDALQDHPWYRENLEEIRLRVGQAPRFRYGSGGDGEEILEMAPLLPEDMQEMYEYLCEYSKYAYSRQVQQGFLALQGGIRVGVAKQENTYPMFFNIRVPRERKGCGLVLLPYLLKEREPGRELQMYHTLILSPPGAGKTTLLRDLVRLLSQAGIGNISVVDERFELAACHEGVPQNDLGQTTDIYAGFDKTTGCMQAIRTMSPQLLVVDEIGSKEDGEILSYAMRCGIQLLATMHGEDSKKYAWLKEHVTSFAQLEFERIIEVICTPEGRCYRVVDQKGEELCIVS